jgi:hypothetical protein
MSITRYQSSKHARLLIHVCFLLIYSLLLVRVIIAMREGDGTFAILRNNSTLTLFVKRLCGILVDPFYNVLFSPLSEGNDWYLATIGLAIFCYALFHYGMVTRISIEGENSRVNRILNFCRLSFSIMGTILLLLVVLRMSVALYYDLAEHVPRGDFVVVDPAQK